VATRLNNDRLDLHKPDALSEAKGQSALSKAELAAEFFSGLESEDDSFRDRCDRLTVGYTLNGRPMRPHPKGTQRSCFGRVLMDAQFHLLGVAVRIPVGDPMGCILQAADAIRALETDADRPDRRFLSRRSIAKPYLGQDARKFGTVFADAGELVVTAADALDRLVNGVVPDTTPREAVLAALGFLALDDAVWALDIAHDWGLAAYFLNEARRYDADASNTLIARAEAAELRVRIAEELSSEAVRAMVRGAASRAGKKSGERRRATARAAPEKVEERARALSASGATPRQISEMLAKECNVTVGHARRVLRSIKAGA
jgi:hypothetical protein